MSGNTTMDQESTGDEEPTAIRETEEDFALKQTSVRVNDRLDQAEAELLRLRQSTSGDSHTPKVNALPELLRELREQRLAELSSRQEENTLRSDVPEGTLESLDMARAARLAEAEAGLEAAAAEDPLEARQRPGFAKEWLWGMVLGALLLGAGFGLHAALTVPAQDALELQLQVEPDNAVVTAGDNTEVPTHGAVALACEGPVTLTITAPGHVTEHHHFPCGTQAVLTTQLAPAD